MTNIIKLPADFYPKKMYRCPFLMHVVKQIYDDDFRDYTEVLAALSNYKPSSTLVFTTQVENNKESCFLMCDQHILLILRAEANYDCASESDDNFLLESLNKRYCKNCAKHCMKKLYYIFRFDIYNELFF